MFEGTANINARRGEVNKVAAKILLLFFCVIMKKIHSAQGSLKTSSTLALSAFTLRLTFEVMRTLN
jgi:hypothetical protein